MPDLTLTTLGLAAQVEGWEPTPVERTDPMGPDQAVALAAVLGADPATPLANGRQLPPLWHWAYFQPRIANTELGPDGHPLHGDFLPPLANRRRLFAGGRCVIEHPLALGTPTRATSSLTSCKVKTGRTGDLLFVAVRTEYTQAGRSCIVDEHDLVYRSGSAANVAAAPTRPRPPVAGEFAFDPVTLFRFSAATANAHRIHYDLPYARDVEGHPGLLVHGPLLILTLTERVRATNPASAAIDYRLHQPVYCGERVSARLSDTPGSTTAELRGADNSVRASVQVRHPSPSGAT